MVVSALGIGVAGIAMIKRNFFHGRSRSFGLGVVLNVVGILSIAAVPENVNEFLHNVCCWIAAAGGVLMLYASEPMRRRCWSALLIVPCLVMAVGLVLHSLHITHFAPWVPTAQKGLILAFVAWYIGLTWSFRTEKGVRVAFVLTALVFLVALLVFVPFHIRCARPSAVAAREVTAATAQGALSADEIAALRWLELVCGELSAEEEKRWWNHSPRQYGIFSLRYHIAFAGYAAASVGFRAWDDCSVRSRVGKVLGNCIERYLRPEVWGYTQSKSYWGRKPWAPDPCYRENVMYTGHLLQLLAFYELFTGDRRYWTNGFDFDWKGRKVHYDVKKLIDVTLYQMRKGPNGGITCEPGLMFFACNNHPHIALSVFSALGYGDWSADARRWEKWALANFRSPIFGGGAINLAWHARSTIMYPRGSAGMDGWSLLWYEAWAKNRNDALSLWQEARDLLDWDFLEQTYDKCEEGDCNDPEPVPGVVASVFMAAAARACDDVETAERLENLVDCHSLVRNDGLYYLDVNRRWMVGVSAQRIIALTESNGLSYRKVIKCDIIGKNLKGCE